MKIGILVGMEDTFPHAFIERVNFLGKGDITAEFVRLGGTELAEPCEYRVIVDRISHEVKYYRGYLKNAVLSGAYVINNPFWWSADDKFFNYSLASRLGVAVPRTILLPQKSYPDTVVSKSLRNLAYPIEWQRIIDYVRMPAILKPFEGGGWKHVYKVHSLEELLHYYDQTGELCMTLQEFIDFDHYVRCFCFGKEEIVPVRYDPHLRRYIVEHDHLSEGLGERIVHDARLLNQALGYDMNTVEFALRGGVPYAIDFLNPAPDFDLYSITSHYFELVVDRMARLAIRYAQRPPEPQPQMRWQTFLS